MKNLTDKVVFTGRSVNAVTGVGVVETLTAVAARVVGVLSASAEETSAT